MSPFRRREPLARGAVVSSASRGSGLELSGAHPCSLPRRTVRSAPSRRDAAVYRAAAALGHDDKDSADQELRNQLRIMAEAAGATPDWATFALAGPVTTAGAEPTALFEWAASVAVPGAVAWKDLPESDVAVGRRLSSDETMPLTSPPPGPAVTRGRGQPGVGPHPRQGARPGRTPRSAGC